MDASAEDRHSGVLVVGDGREAASFTGRFAALEMAAESSSPEDLDRRTGAPGMVLLALAATDSRLDGLVRGLRRDGARVVVRLDRDAGDVPARARQLYECGADAVVPASVGPDLVVLQCCALLGLWAPRDAPAAVGRARFDPANRRLLLPEGPVRLTEAESKILQLLVEARSAYVARDRISRTVFHIPYDRFDRRIDVHVSNLRRKLRENAVGATVDTSRLAGLRLAGPPSTSAAEPVASASDPAAVVSK